MTSLYPLNQTLNSSGKIYTERNHSNCSPSIKVTLPFTIDYSFLMTGEPWMGDVACLFWPLSILLHHMKLLSHVFLVHSNSFLKLHGTLPCNVSASKAKVACWIFTKTHLLSESEARLCALLASDWYKSTWEDSRNYSLLQPKNVTPSNKGMNADHVRLQHY